MKKILLGKTIFNFSVAFSLVTLMNMQESQAEKIYCPTPQSIKIDHDSNLDSWVYKGRLGPFIIQAKSPQGVPLVASQSGEAFIFPLQPLLSCIYQRTNGDSVYLFVTHYDARMEKCEPKGDYFLCE